MKTKLNQSKLKLAIVSAMLVGSAGFSTAGYAATAAGNMLVTTDVSLSCSMTVGAMNFANYDPSSVEDLLGSATIESTCTSGGTAKITMGEGSSPNTGSLPSAPDRRMVLGSEYLSYAIYSDTGRTTVWGDTADTGKGITGTGSASDTLVYGKITAGQAVGSGTFGDSVVVTLTY